MIHKYKYNGSCIVLDVNSGSIHVVDDLAFDAIDYFGKNMQEAINLLKKKYSETEIIECFSELSELKKDGKLFSAPFNVNFDKKPVVKALCLHIAHDCNLKCKYCFAGDGGYHGTRSLMSAKTGVAAIDFLVKNSKNRKNLEIDFFGGEPTLNFDVVKQIVMYAKKEKSKNFRFTLTTNAFSIDDDIVDFCNEHMVNVVLSIDGRKEINDACRPDRAGNGSYDKIVRNIDKFLTKRQYKNYFVRGTFTRNNLDFSNDVVHLADLGFCQISIEPVVSNSDAPYSLRDTDLPRIYKEYDLLTDIMLSRKDINFFHFNIDLTGGSCVYKRVSGCGAGCSYMSVTPNGDLYPCHQFTALKGFKIGTVTDGITDTGIPEKFSEINILTKKACNDCWAKFYCSGGCAANSYLIGGDVTSNYELGCKLQKKRIECAVYLQLAKNGIISIDA